VISLIGTNRDVTDDVLVQEKNKNTEQSIARDRFYTIA